VTGPWQLATADLVGVVDRRVITWDRAWDDGRGGLAESSAIDGNSLRTRTISGLARNGGLRLWQPVPGGYLAFWDSPAFVTEHGDELALSWSARPGDWSTEHVVIGGAAIFGCTRAGAGVVRIALDDGHEAWRVPLPPGIQDVTIDTDDQLVYATWSEPDAGAPARRIRAIEPATGRTVWTHDFATRPGALVVANGIIVAALGGELHFIDGASGRVRAEVALGHPEVYPAVRIDRGHVYAAHGDTVTAFTLATGQPLWHAAVALDGGPRLAIAGDQLVVSTAAGTALALDRSSGERRWEIGLGMHPHALVSTAAALVGLGPDGATGFGLPVSFPAESARLHGRIVPGGCGAVDAAIVAVGDTRVTLDAGGRYRVHITARGIVTVTVTTAHPSSLATPSIATVRLDGRGEYRVPDLTPGRCDQE
jgi:hypothetical protein